MFLFTLPFPPLASRGKHGGFADKICASPQTLLRRLPRRTHGVKDCKVMEEDEGSPPPRRLSRKRSKESPSTRREKDRLRKKKARQKRQLARSNNYLSDSSEEGEVQHQDHEEQEQEGEEAGLQQHNDLFALGMHRQDIRRNVIRQGETQGNTRIPLALPPSVGHQHTDTQHTGEAEDDEEQLDPQNTVREQDGNSEETPNYPPEDQYHSTPAEKLALAVASIKGCSRVSDQAITKVLQEIAKNLGTFQELLQNGTIQPNYTKSLRPLAIKHIPPVKTNLYLERKEAHEYHYMYIRNLEAIPAEFCNLPPSSPLQVLREESYVRLEDLRKHHEKTHLALNMKLHDIRKEYSSCTLSMDGVEEAKNCKTTFQVISIRIGRCVYLHKILNPLVGYEAAKPSPESMLRWV